VEKMSKVSIDIDVKDIGKIINNLPLRDKIKLTKELERQTLGKIIDEIFKRIDQRRKKFPISQREIRKEIKAVREEIYAKSSS
jgi:hypothetical protein